MGPAPGPPERPFVGLRPFKSHEGLIFFGRQRQVVELLERLHRVRFVGVIGSSGSGKSSLIYAGLVPALQAGFLVGDRDRWLVVKLTPGDNPWLRLSDALREGLRKVGLEDATVSAIRETAERGGVSGLVDLMGPLLEKANANLLLFVDQFEEIFRRDTGARTSQQHEEDTDFVSVVLGLSQQRAAPVFVVFTMRSDHLGDCDAFLGLPEALNESQYLVPRLARDDVRQAIEGPIRLFQKDVAPRLVDRLLNDLGGQPDQLPVLQHALMRMWMRLVESGQPVMDVEHYLEVGTLTDALWRHADEALAGMDAASIHPKDAVKAALDGVDKDELQIFKTIFQALTDTDYANRKVRRWQNLRGLRQLTGRTLPELHALLERFVDDRRSFLRYSGESGTTGPEAALVDISHESLIRQWDRLRGWVDEEAQNRDNYVHIRDDAKRWESGVGSLWDGPQLVQAREWWDKRRPTAAWARRYGDGFKAADTFLRESERKRDLEKWREQEDDRKEQERLKLESEHALMRRTQRRTAAAAVIASSLAAMAFWQWRRAEAESSRAESGEQAALALSVLRTDPEQSLRRAMQSVEKAETSTAASALREALAVAVVRKLWSLPLPRASAVTFSPDGRRLAAGAATREAPGRVGIWDAATGRLEASLCDQDVAALRWTPDGSGVLVVLNDGGVVLWRADGETASRTTLVSAPGVEQVEDVELRPDGRELAMAAGDKGVLRFDLDLAAAQPSARLRNSPAAPPDAIVSVAYSPDGRLLAVGGSRRTLALIDTATDRRVCETKPLGVDILRVVFSGRRLGLVAASSFDHTIRSWPVEDCRAEPRRHIGHRALVTDLGFTSDGNYLVSVSHDSTIKLWDPRAGDEVFSRRMTRSGSGRISAYDFSRVAAAPPPAEPSAGAAAVNRIATVGADPDEDAPTRETLSLWDVAPRTKADMLRGLTGGAQAHDLARLPGLLSLARELQVDPKFLEDQVPGCP